MPQTFGMVIETGQNIIWTGPKQTWVPHTLQKKEKKREKNCLTVWQVNKKAVIMTTRMMTTGPKI